MKSLATLFNPQSIAIVGASKDQASISGQPLKYLMGHGYKGRIYPVNPRYADIEGLPCFPEIALLPEVPDVVLVAVAAKNVPAVLEQCGARGVPFAIVLSSGFAEAGETGSDAQKLIAELGRRFGLGVVGPNCQGMMNIAEGIRLGFGTPFGIPYRKGATSLVSQSGAFGNAILMLAEESGLGFRQYLSTGNEAGVTSLDVIDHLINDDGTKLIAAYVEGFKDAARIGDVGRKALAADKPIIVWKVGNSIAGARAAASHTANICGEPSIYRTAFKQWGFIEVDDVDELVDCAIGLLSGFRPLGKRVAVVTLSGGAGIAMADRCEALGLSLPQLEESTTQQLKPLLPAFASAQNPLDLTADIGADADAFGAVLRLVAADASVDMIGLAMAALSGTVAEKFAEVIAGISRESRKAIFVSWNARSTDATAAYERIDLAGVPRFRTPGRCARGLAAVADYAVSRRNALAAKNELPLSLSVPTARKRLQTNPQTLTEFESKKVLSAYGLRVTREFLVQDWQQAVLSAQKIAGPVALKIQSSELPHKSDIGGVHLGLSEASAIRAAFDSIVGRARRDQPTAQISGVLVQEMVSDSIEVIIGVDNTSPFGPVIMFGLGGVYAEIFGDVTFRVAPITARDADQMIREVKCFRLLQGARGRPAADMGAIREALLRISAMAVDLKDDLAELDVNPLFVMPEGQGAIVGDALIRSFCSPGGERLSTVA